MKTTRHFIERRTGPKTYHPIGTQPAEGFASVKDAVDWLVARGWVRRRLGLDGEQALEGFGGERGYYLREREVAMPDAMLSPVVAVQIGGRPTLVRTYGEFVQEFGAPPYGRLLLEERRELSAWTWRDELRDRVQRLLARLRKES